MMQNLMSNYIDQSKNVFMQMQEQMQKKYAVHVPRLSLSRRQDRRHQERMTSARVGFVSLGCPKALVDSERIITQLRAEGYEIAPDYEGADLVVVNTCGFIDDAVQESLDAIGEALQENGKVIVTGCLGAKASGSGNNLIKELHPSVLAVTGPHATAEVMQAVHHHLPRPHDPFTDLVPEQGIRLTPRHYAYLKISEGCNHRCSFCIIPACAEIWSPGQSVKSCARQKAW